MTSENEKWQEWTHCEMYGHKFQEKICIDYGGGKSKVILWQAKS